MDASCGPSSALSQLSKHTQRDNSLQHEAARQGHHFPQAAFRNQPGVDANLNRDFQQFSQGGGLEYDTFNGQAHNFPRQQFGGGAPNQARFHDRPAEQQQWAQDFNRLSLGNNTQMQPQQARQAQTANWSQQFLQHKQQNTANQNLRPESSYLMQQPMFNQVNLQMMQGQQMMQRQVNQEQNPISQVEQIDSKALDAHFDQISREMDQMEEVDTTTEDPDKEAFAKVAKQVESHMTSTTPLVSAETTSKFQQSNFLKLMSMISNREVEVSKEGDKLVASSGEDVREYLSDPLKHERSEANIAGPSGELALAPAPQEPQSGTITNESAHIRSHLPDPLAHIKDGELPGDLSSLQAARVISGGQVEKENWMEDQSWDFDMRPRTKNSLLNRYEQEVYDDYRNDDDFH